MMSRGERDTRMLVCRQSISRSIWHTVLIQGDTETLRQTFVNFNYEVLPP